MKKLIFIIASMLSILASGQNGISDILAAGVEAGQRFSNSYMSPAGEAFSYNISTGWYDDARVLDAGKFKLQLRAQATFSPDDKKSFSLNPLEYQQLIQESYDNSGNPPANIEVTFGDGSQMARDIATALGSNATEQQLIVTSREATSGVILQQDVITLPQGIGNAGLDLVPTAFLQASVGIGFGLEIKGRLVPEISTNEAQTSLYGLGAQWELSKLLTNEEKNLPVNIALLAGYTKLNASYDFEDGAIVSGENQSIETEISSLNFSAIISTNYKVLNLYGGLNYNSGTSTTNLLGTYRFNSNTVFFPVSATVEDPISVATNVSGVLATAGFKLSLGAFNIHADYTFGEFNTATASVFFRI